MQNNELCVSGGSCRSANNIHLYILTFCNCNPNFISDDFSHNLNALLSLIGLQLLLAAQHRAFVLSHGFRLRLNAGRGGISSFSYKCFDSCLFVSSRHSIVSVRSFLDC